MHLNDILQKYSIEEISQTTRIPARNLESLLHGEWSHLKKVQALGFISGSEGLGQGICRWKGRLFDGSQRTKKDRGHGIPKTEPLPPHVHL